MLQSRRGARFLALWVLLAACASGSAPAEPVRPEVEVTPPTGEKPHSIAVAALPPNTESVRRALQSAGVELRGGGRRERLVIRYLPLDLAAESLFLDAAALDPDAFSDPQAFGPADAIQVRSVADEDTPIGFTLHLLPTGVRRTNVAAPALLPRRGLLRSKNIVHYFG